MPRPAQNTKQLCFTAKYAYPIVLTNFKIANSCCLSLGGNLKNADLLQERLDCIDHRKVVWRDIKIPAFVDNWSFLILTIVLHLTFALWKSKQSWWKILGKKFASICPQAFQVKIIPWFDWKRKINFHFAKIKCQSIRIKNLIGCNLIHFYNYWWPCYYWTFREPLSHVFSSFLSGRSGIQTHDLIPNLLIRRVTTNARSFCEIPMSFSTLKRKLLSDKF